MFLEGGNSHVIIAVNMASKDVSSPPKNKRPKKTKCTDAENIILLEIALEKMLLTSHFQNGMTLKKKELVQKIADQVNAMGGHGRTVTQIKNWWKD